MFNPNAKAFIPGGSAAAAAPPVVPEEEGLLYRYKLNFRPSKRLNFSSDPHYLSNVAALMTSRHLFSDKTALATLESLQNFVMSSFETFPFNHVPAANNPTGPNAGFLITRRLIDPKDFAAMNDLNACNGFLICLNMPEVQFWDHSLQLQFQWTDFYRTFSKEEFVTAVGYTWSIVGVDSPTNICTFKHFFFIAFDETEGAQAAIERQLAESYDFQNFVRVNSIVPFACNPSAPLNVIITVGSISSEGSDLSNVLHTTNVDFDPCNLSPEPLEAVKRDIKSTLSGSCKWEHSYTIHVRINPLKAKGSVVYPVWDLIHGIGMFCSHVGVYVGGVSFESESVCADVKRLLSNNLRVPLFVKAPIDTVMLNPNLLNVRSIKFGGFPQALRYPVTLDALNIISKITPLVHDIKSRTSTPLSRKTFAQAAKHIASGSYGIRKTTVGGRIALGTDGDGNLFGVDCATNSYFGIPKSFPGVSKPPPNSLFSATVTASYRRFLEYRIIIDDVVLFGGQDVRLEPFYTRWKLLEDTGIEDENAWPHSTPNKHIVVLKACYNSFVDELPKIMKKHSEHATLGYTLVDDDATFEEGNSLNYSWVDPRSVTVTFAVSSTEVIDEATGVSRAFFSVLSSDGKLVPVGSGEYADYSVELYRDIRPRSIVSCILQRAPDGAHWWEVLECLSDTDTPFSEEQVKDLIHSLGVTSKEFEWLTSAPSHLCARCGNVNDAGMMKDTEYWCLDCWKGTGHGNCVHCGRKFEAGMIDALTQFFYCEHCWNDFRTTNTNSEQSGHVPPPPNSTFATQVLTRGMSALVNLMSTKCPTGDVLDLCCGGSLARKWMMNGTKVYLGVDIKDSAVDECNQLATSCPDLPNGASYQAICADAFSEHFWTDILTRIHPRQFHTITCFSALETVFKNEKSARHFVASVANALVPGGGFFGIIIDVNYIFSEDRKKKTGDVVSVDWSESTRPTLGNTYEWTVEDNAPKTVNVAPLDFFIAIAADFGLQVVQDACLPLRDLIRKNYWGRPFTHGEKEYLCSLRSFAFKKECNEQLPDASRKS